jgi:hypothetical protein
VQSAVGTQMSALGVVQGPTPLLSMVGLVDSSSGRVLLLLPAADFILQIIALLRQRRH